MKRIINPVLKGLYADPAMILVGDTYYLYPTTDGFSNWSGHQFKVFSSKDLQNWQDEGVILDLKTEQVQWAIGYAWAPAIVKKNEYYYFYYCGKRPDGISGIGVAKGQTPIGPFQDIGKPLLTIEMVHEAGVKMGQVIDPEIFVEDDGTPYLLFGNGHAAIVELNEDMISVKLDTLTNIEGLFDFREALHVLKRGNYYHFTWSCDDTGNENYHVNYGISDHLFGPVHFQYTILEKNPSKDIYGTGHHTIIKGKEEHGYIIAYHRFATPSTLYLEGKGYHREVCIDLLTFDEKGLINPICPS